MKKLTHEEKHAQCIKEIKATLIAVLLCCIWHVGSAFLLNGSGKQIMHMPAWFVVSVFGSALIAIISVIYIVKNVFVDFEYDDGEEDEA